jgi:hypothetical protein
MKKTSATNTVLIQTRVPKDVAAWLKRKALDDGDTIAGWLRRFLVSERRFAKGGRR